MLVISWVSILLALIAVLMSVASSIGIYATFVSMIFAGIATAFDRLKLALLAAAISSVNVVFIWASAVEDGNASRELAAITVIILLPLAIGFGVRKYFATKMYKI